VDGTSFHQSGVCHTFPSGGNPTAEVMEVSYVNPAIREKFESLPIELKNHILERNVRLNTVQDLIAVLEQIVAEGE